MRMRGCERPWTRLERSSRRSRISSDRSTIEERTDRTSRKRVTGETALNAYSIAATTPLSFGLHPGTRESLTPQKRKARILVVDDDPGLLRLLTRSEEHT